MFIALAIVCGLTASCSEERTEAEVDWRLTSSPDGRELSIRAEYGGSSCTEFKRWDVSESGADVTVRATVEFFGDSCTSDLVYESASIVLDEPLGDRQLLGCRPVSAATAGSNRSDASNCRDVAE